MRCRAQEPKQTDNLLQNVQKKQTIRYKMCEGNECATNSTLLKRWYALLASGITDVADKCLTKPSWRLGREAAIGIVEFVGA